MLTNSAESILENAGGCPTLRRTVFQFLDRFESLRLSEVSRSWREHGSDAASWLPTLIQFQHSQSSRSQTIAASPDVFSPSHSASSSSSATSASPPSSSSSSLNKQKNKVAVNTSSSNIQQRQQQQSSLPTQTSTTTITAASAGGSYSHPQLAPDAGYGIYTPASRQLIARNAFGPTTIFSGQPVPGYVLESLWNFQQTEMWYCVTECFRKPPREMALALEQAEKLFGLSIARQSSSVNVNSAMVNVQNQMFLTLQLLCHPVYEKRTEKRFFVLFPCVQILLRCPMFVRAAAIDWKVSSSLTNSLAISNHFKIRENTITTNAAAAATNTSASNVDNAEHDKTMSDETEEAEGSPSSSSSPSNTNTRARPPAITISGSNTSATAGTSTSQQQQQQQQNTTYYNSNSAAAIGASIARQISPIPLLFTEVLRWHDSEPSREHAPWFAALASWASVAPTIFTELPFHPVLILPHVLTLKSLCIPSTASPSLNSPNSSFAGDSTSGAGVVDSTGSSGGKKTNPSSSSPNRKNPTQQQKSSTKNDNTATNKNTATSNENNKTDEETREMHAIRNMLKKNVNTISCVRIAVQSAVEIAVRLYRVKNSLQIGGGNKSASAFSSSSSSTNIASSSISSSSVEGEAAKNLLLVFRTLAKMELIMPQILWNNDDDHSNNNSMVKKEESSAAGNFPWQNFIEKEVEREFEQLGNSQIGINFLFAARGEEN